MVTHVENYGQQSYNPPVINAFLGRNWCLGKFTLTTGSSTDFFHLDSNVIVRGGPVTTGAVEPDIPVAGLIVRISFQCTASGINFMPRVDIGTVAVNMMPGVGAVCPAGFSLVEFDFSGFGLWGAATRIAASNTQVEFHVSVTCY